MDTKHLQKNIDSVFKENFGYTSFKERLSDIQREFFELSRWQDLKNVKEETGDLLSSLIQLCNENDWELDEVVGNTLTKINNRSHQYKSLGRKTTVGILGGHFSPITVGHIQTAQFVLNSTNTFDEVWLMPSYDHLHKKRDISPEDRLAMCELAAQVDGRIKVFDYEIRNELAGETFNFFKRLKTEHTLNEKYNFSMIIGLDNANTFDKWVNYEELEKMVRFVVIPRKGVERDIDVDWYLKEPHIFINSETDIMEISSTQVRSILERDGVAKYTSLEGLLDPEVVRYIYNNKLYQPSVEM